ncbi:two-component response regulator-like APRR3 [Humulus lupulus]|uniref:two-component response regulator-like APRR3 n=1 Tax=Humulus lupulus TaxID=3486 RepID=UPI002B401F36|nr:two-component response regulator-like APRR3 [Humulus lupulus]
MSEFCVSKHVPGFAKGLQILVVDNDRECLSIMATMLQLCSYKVTTTEQVSEALSMIEEQETSFKLVMACIDMPDMDPISFLKASLKRGIGVIMISSNRSGDLANKALDEGASLFLMKPVSMEVLKQLWQSACWKNTKLSEENQNGNNGKKSEDNNVIREAMTTNMIGTTISKKRPRWQSCTTLSDNDEEFEKTTSSEKQEGPQSKRLPSGIVIEKSHRDRSKRKRPCVVWTPELHNKFTEAISLLGDESNAMQEVFELSSAENNPKGNGSSTFNKTPDSKPSAGYQDDTLQKHRVPNDYLPICYYLLFLMLSKKYKAEVKRVQENNTSLPFGGKSSVQSSQLERQQSSMAYQLGREDLRFGQFSLTQPGGNGQASSATYPKSSLRKGKQPLELDGCRVQVSGAASPNLSSGVFKVNNFFLQENQNQETPPSLDFGFNSNRYQNQPSQEVAWTAGVPGQTLKTNFSDGSQNIDTVVNQTTATTTGGSSKQNQPISEYVDYNILRILEEEDDDNEPNNYGCGPNMEDVDRYCEWLQKSI